MLRSTERVREQTLSFPTLVTFGALAMALLLLLSSTVPALVEQRQLERTLEETSRLRHEYVRRLAELRRSDGGGPEDLQSLLVAIDGLGLTPAELLALYPEEAEEGDTVDRQQLRHDRGN